MIKENGRVALIDCRGEMTENEGRPIEPGLLAKLELGQLYCKLGAKPRPIRISQPPALSPAAVASGHSAPRRFAKGRRTVRGNSPRLPVPVLRGARPKQCWLAPTLKPSLHCSLWGR